MQYFVGDKVHTPRFLSVRLEAVFSTIAMAHEAGYTETTHLDDEAFSVWGKVSDSYHVTFAAAMEPAYHGRK